MMPSVEDFGFVCMTGFFTRAKQVKRIEINDQHR